MNKIEAVEVANLPEKYKPLSPWAYFGLSILFSVPIVGFIFMIVFACSPANINRRNFARSYFCILAIALVLCGIALAASLAQGGIEALKQLLQNLK